MKRHVLPILIFLLLGAVLNVAVAVGVCRMVSRSGDPAPAVRFYIRDIVTPSV